MFTTKEMDLKTFIFTKYFVLHLLYVGSKSILINRTNIIYQYSMLCGPDTYTDPNRIRTFSKIPEEYRLCPKCNHHTLCYQYGDCCPDVYVQFPPLDCYDVTLYDYQNRQSNRYELVVTCPAAVSKNIADKCTKQGDIYYKLRNPPVTSESTGLSFKNAFCAKCHSINDVTPWQISIHNACGKNFDLYTVDEIITTIIKDNCSAITFSPDNIMPAKTCSRLQVLQDTNAYIDTCNKTGTWMRYDKDIVFACENFGNKFKFYKNIFCYICNPPYVSERKSLFSFCNVTGNWKTYDDGIYDGCIKGGLSDAAYPFKNIFCYICNMAVPPSTDYFLHVPSLSSFQYYIFDTSDNFNLSIIYSDNTCDQNAKMEVEFYKSYSRYECQSHLPIGILNSLSSSLVVKLAIAHNCSLSLAGDNAPSMTNNSEWISEIKFAFLTNTYRLAFVDKKSEAFCYNFQDNHLCDILKLHMSFNCNSIYSDSKAYRQPFENVICQCGVLRSDISVGLGQEKSVNIYYIDQYPTMSEKCFGDEIFDKRQQKCRKSGCFFGQGLKDGDCVQVPNDNHNPNILIGNQLMLLTGYTLPLVIKIPYTHLYSENTILEIKEELESIMNLTFNITANLCLTALRNGHETHVILQVDIVSGISISPEGRNLQLFVSYSIEHQLKYHNFSVFYDSVTRDFINNNINSSQCTRRWRPLLSKVIFCRHVIYNDNEYQISLQTAKIIGYRNTFEFYEYDLKGGKLMICIEDFERLEVDENTHFISYVILIVCNVVSLVFLALTFLTYCLFPSLRTIPGKLIMNLSFSLMCHYLTYILIMFEYDGNIWCTVLGILVHYFLLTSIGSLFVFAWHMFKIFGTSSLASSMAASQNQQASIQYLLFTYLYALIIVILNVIVNIVVTSGFSIGYDEHTCFISYKESIIGCLILPLLILSFADIILFTVTVYRLLRRPKKNNGDGANRKDVIIFAKLFVTTGCSWILLVINVFVNDKNLTLTISCINSIQGLFIFIAYICNKRIFDMYKAKIRNMTRTEKSVNGSPTTSLSSLSRIRTNIVDQNTPFLQKSK